MTAELEIRDSPRYLAGSLGDLEVTITRDGSLVDPTSAGSVTVTDEDGNVLSSGAATLVGGSTGQLRYTPTAAVMADVNRLTVTWASVVLGADTAITITTTAEVVGDMLFTEREARAFDDGAMAVTATYTDDDIRRGHDAVMDEFERILRYPLGRRYYRDVVSGNGRDKLRLNRSGVQAIRAVSKRAAGSQTWTAFTQAQLDDLAVTDWGLVERETLGEWEQGTRNYRISYEAGREIPGALRLAGMRVLRHLLVPSSLPDRALYQTNELGQFRLAVAGDDGRWFGIPDVDALLLRMRERHIW
jgi:hypothetical protein